jgi:hypothetical protein
VRRALLICIAVAASAAVPSADIIQNATPPAGIVARAQAYLVSRVGADYAARNYELRTGETTSIGMTAEGPPRSYTLVYVYRAWSEAGAPDSRIYVEVPAASDGSASGYVATFDNTGKVITPKVTRSEAEAKMRAAIRGAELKSPLVLGVPGHDPTTHPEWSAVFPTGQSDGSCWTSRRVTVDAITGDVTASPDETACE